MERSLRLKSLELFSSEILTCTPTPFRPVGSWPKQGAEECRFSYAPALRAAQVPSRSGVSSGE